MTRKTSQLFFPKPPYYFGTRPTHNIRSTYKLASFGKWSRIIKSRPENTGNKTSALPQEDVKSTASRGFTLIELLVALSLVLILLVGTAQLAIQALDVKRRADSNLKATELASSKLEYFKSLPYDSPELTVGLHKESYIPKGTHEIFWKKWKIQETNPNMKRIEIESYSKSFPQKKICIALFLSKELGF